MSCDLPEGVVEVNALPANWGATLTITIDWPNELPVITGQLVRVGEDCKPAALANMTFVELGPRSVRGTLQAVDARMMAIGRRNYFRVEVVREEGHVDAIGPIWVDAA